MIVTGGKGDICEVIRGTYIHSSFLPALGMWISPKFYFLAAKIIENFAIRSFRRANFELENKLKQVDLESKQLTEALHAEQILLKGATDQVANLARELTDNQELLTHSSYRFKFHITKKFLINIKLKFNNWKMRFKN